jgi:hypothetical protein
MLKDYWSTVTASMGGTLDFRPLVALSTALYYHLTPTLVRGCYWRLFLLDDDRRGGQTQPRSAILNSRMCLPIACLLAQPCAVCGEVSRATKLQGSFIFVSLTIVYIMTLVVNDRLIEIEA